MWKRELYSTYGKTSLKSIPNMEPLHYDMFHQMRIRTTSGYLQAAHSRPKRERLHARTKISMDVLLEYANHADLLRIKRMGKAYIRLLNDAQVFTTRDLAFRNPHNLLQTLQTIKRWKEYKTPDPWFVLVQSWVKEAKALRKVITY